jgi:thiamine kinase-like enzyme
MQSKFWGLEMEKGALDSRELRRQFLMNPLLEKTYDAFLAECTQIPATLCHDDLLPFNVIVSENRAVLIDWECNGILPYPTSLARLIAHGEEDETAFFYMTAEDKQFAIDYYYDKLVKNRLIPYNNYRKSLDLCLFYEYCEWVYVGNKYNDCTGDRYRKYLQLATEFALKIGF